MRITRREGLILTAGAVAALTGCEHLRGGVECRMTVAELKNRLRGMIRFSAYADALGAPEELANLNGDISAGDPAKKTLKKLKDYGRERSKPFGVWIDPAANGEKIGVPTDDTGIRVSLVYDWLCALAKTGAKPTEAGFLAYLQKVKTGPSDWDKARKGAADAFVRMIVNAQKFKKNPSADPNTINTDFFFTDQPVVFGPFLYLELAALSLCCPRKDVFKAAEGFSCLDLRYGKFVTGLFAVAMSRAACAKKEKGGFAKFFFGEADKVFAGRFGDRAQRRSVKAGYDAGRKAGAAARKARMSEKDFLKELQKLFRAAPPPLPGRDGYRVFDPLLFLKLIAAAVEYGNGDLGKTLRVLACGPGDTDTMPMLIASIMGAWCGDEELSKTFGKDMDKVEACLKTFGKVDIDKLVECQVKLAKQHGCCKITAGS